MERGVGGGAIHCVTFQYVYPDPSLLYQGRGWTRDGNPPLSPPLLCGICGFPSYLPAPILSVLVEGLGSYEERIVLLPSCTRGSKYPLKFMCSVVSIIGKAWQFTIEVLQTTGPPGFESVGVYE